MAAFRILFRLAVFYLLCLVNLVVEENRTFTRKPGNMTVLANTTALFDWRHTILNMMNVTDHTNVTKTVNNVAISWYYLGKRREQWELLMSCTSTKGLYKAPSYQSDRLGYLEEADSAAIQLDMVTPTDEGLYQVRVVDPTDPAQNGFYISDISRMNITKVSDLKLSVTLENQTYPDLGLPTNGSAIGLPSLSVSVPDRVYVNISVSQTAPLPDIKMATSVGDVLYPELPCGKTYFCERNIPITTSHAKEENDAYLQLTISFQNVENLETITIHVPVEISDQHTDTTEGQWKTSVNFVGITLATIIVLFVITIILISFIVLQKSGKCKIITRGDNNSTKTTDSDCSSGENSPLSGKPKDKEAIAL